jgi:DNA-binding response OmpR family regulator
MPANMPVSALWGRTILVAEDEILLGLELVDELQDRGAIPIGPTPSVERAITAIQNEPLDAALLNVFLRGQIAFPVADALRARNIPFLFVTGNDAFVREHFPDVPAHPKPYEMATIVAALDLLLRRTG